MQLIGPMSISFAGLLCSSELSPAHYAIHSDPRSKAILMSLHTFDADLIVLRHTSVHQVLGVGTLSQVFPSVITLIPITMVNFLGPLTSLIEPDDARTHILHTIN
jgi:hypothetical protein